jgi:lipid-A-disaccharide synthase-like uncharacterized protein
MLFMLKSLLSSKTPTLSLLNKCLLSDPIFVRFSVKFLAIYNANYNVPKILWLTSLLCAKIPETSYRDDYNG